MKHSRTTIQVLFFTQIRELLGKEDERLQLPMGSRVGDLEQWLVGHWPEISHLLGSVTYAVNNEYVGRDGELKDGDVVALITPISGG